MKNLLKKYLGNSSIKKKNSGDFIKFALSENSTFIDKELQSFFWQEQKRVQKRDKEYEKSRVRKTISFELDEFKIVQEKMDKLEIKDFSTFAKSILLKKKINSPIERELIYELSKIGNNLNQIAKRVNQDNKAPILTELVEIERAIKSLTNAS